jgi:oligopeptide/dipeptide ABC transporter ATP-binding protein
VSGVTALAAPALEVRDLTVEATARGRVLRLVEHVDLAVARGEIVGLIGESGSGKTMTAMAVLGLLPRNARVVRDSSIRLSGRELVGLPEAEHLALRGNRIALVPQDALRGLNPVLRVGTQVGEPLNLHRGRDLAGAAEAAVGLLDAVHIPEPARRARDYPHQFSGGMQQRAMVAMGLALEPELLVADEPTTALDVTVQAQVLTLLREIRDTHGTAILFITHDLGIVASLCDRVYVMYAGTIVEEGPVATILRYPSHPYTRALLRATPTVEAVAGELYAIPGQIPEPDSRGRGCRFADRCPHRFEPCAAEPGLIPAGGPGHHVRCWLAAPPGGPGR